MSETNEATTFAVKQPRANRQMAERIAALEGQNKPEAEPTEEVTEQQPTEPEATEVSEEGKGKPKEGTKERDEGYWERRSSVLAGLLEQANSEAKEAKKKLNEKVKALEDQLVELSNQKNASKEYDLRQYVPESELEEMDQKELTTAIRIAVEEARKDAAESFKRELAPIREELEQSKQVNAQMQREAFMQKLRALSPNFEQLDKDPAFLEWLSEKDRFAGVDRLTLLRRAEAQNNAEGVAVFFNAFQEEHKPKARTKPTPQVDPVGEPAPSGQDVNAPAVRRSQIKDFYDLVRRGKIKPGTKQYTDMERKIDLATQHGTIVEG